MSWLSSEGTPELQLYDFDNAEASAPDLTADLYLARRDGDDGPELVYLPLSAVPVSSDFKPDSEVDIAQTSSLQMRELSDTVSSTVKVL